MHRAPPSVPCRSRDSRCNAGVRLVAALGLWLGLGLACAAQGREGIASASGAPNVSGELRIASWSAPQFRLGNPNDDPQLGEGAPGQLFGDSMALDGDTLAVGAWRGWNDQGQPTGAVYIFARVGGEWVRQAKLLAPDARSYDAFGGELALEGNTLIVGAHNYSRPPFSYQGAAYVFARDALGWHYQQTLLETTPQSSGRFGAVIALNQNTLAISSPVRQIGALSRAGAVYLFARNGGQWQSQQEITAPEPVADGVFGSSLLLLDDELLVGASGEEQKAGAAYVFGREDTLWAMRQRLVPQVANAQDLFGTDIAGNSDRVLISSPAHWINSSAPGQVIEWRRIAGQWVQGQSFSTEMLPNLSKFGRGLNYRDGRWLVSAVYMPSAQSMTGVDLFVYEVIAGSLSRTQQIGLPYAGGSGYGVRSLASSADQVLVGLPESFAFPYAEAGEVRVHDMVPPGAGAQLTLNNGGTATGEGFGSAVAANAEWLLVGTPGERRRSATAGAVFAYPREAVDQVQPAALWGNDAVPRDRFGSTLAWSDDTLLVGAPGNAGAVYHFAWVGSQWMQIDKWPAPSSTSQSLFGNAIAATSQRVVIGAENEPIPGTGGSGVAYVYERGAAGWQAPDRLQVSDADSQSSVGRAVAIEQDTIALGAVPFIANPFGFPELGEGAAYVFVRTAQGWVEQAKLLRPIDEDLPGAFGMAVAMLGETLFVGAPRAEQVHIFMRQGENWSWMEMLTAPDASLSGFGSKLGVSDGQLWVGAETGVGGVHRYQLRDGHWQLQQSFALGGEPRFESYSTSFTAVGDHLYVGAPGTPGHSPGIHRAGSVFVHELPLFSDDFER